MLSQLIALLPLLAVASASPINKRDGTLIRSGRDGFCLAVDAQNIGRYGPVANGTPVVTKSCVEANTWYINRGSGSITVPGLDLALDIGLNPGNNGALKVWQSYPGSPQQTWYLTDDNRIAQTGGNQCLDEGDNGVQTYQCTTGNTNQVWYIDFDNSSPTTMISPTTSASASPSASATSSPAIGHQVKFGNQCLTATSEVPGDGTPVTLGSCLSSPSNTFLFANNNGLRLFNTLFCLDAGSDPANGIPLKLWSCGGYAQQSFSPTSAGLIRTTNNQCLDVKADEPSVVQTWECSNPDPQQQFVITS